MNTTLLQEQHLQRYLRDVVAYLDTLPPENRQEELARLKERIHGDLSRIRDTEAADREFDRLVRQFEPAKEPQLPTLKLRLATVPASWQLSELAHPSTWQVPAWVRPVALSTRNVEWLGVCAGVAEHFGWNPFYVRVATLTLGLLTGPLALMAYVFAFIAMSTATEREVRPRVDFVRLAVSLAGTVATALAVYAVAQALTVIMLHVSGSVVAPEETSLDPSHVWYLLVSGRWLFYALVATVPLAALGGLPLAHRWNDTMVKVAQAGLAVYGMAVCFGVASLFVGVLIQLVQHSTGIVIGSV